MHPILKDAAGSPALLLGNEAIVRGALEAGVGVATGYPGTPASEVGDTFRLVAAERLLHFEYSINEKVAYEAAYGACLGGVRAICSMKHLGLNVAADPLVTSAYVGTVAGFVIVSAADPGCHTSPNEQDHRYLARMSYIPVLDPTDPAEALAMSREAFALSERWRVPVILRPTTRIAHTQGVVTLGPLPPRPVRGEFTRDPSRFVPIPPNARRERLELLERIAGAARDAESSPFNVMVKGSGRLGIVTTGVAHAYVMDALDELELAGEVSVLKLGIPFPLARGLVGDLLGSCDRVLVVEELEPFLEDQVKAACAEAGSGVRVSGKGDGTLPVAGEYGPGMVRRAVAGFAGARMSEAPAPSKAPALPPRPAILCAGCPHRSSFQAVNLAVDGRAVFMNDIGCYTLGYGPPHHTADVLLSMGSCLPQGSGLGAATGRKAVAFIGDSTFFHAGLTGLLNAAYNRHDLLVVVLDNRVTGMTGHQPSPSTPAEGVPGLVIEDVARACGASHVVVVDPTDQRATVQAVREAYAMGGLRVVVSRAACPVHEARTRGLPEIVYEVDHARCSVCHVSCAEAACGLGPDAAFARLRAGQRIEKRPGGTAQGLAPCTAGCPVDLCVQGFLAAFRSGNVVESYRIIRQSLPLPSVVARICPRFCEAWCVRAPVDGPVAVNDVKRVVTDLVTDADRAAVREALVKAPPSGRRVAVVGAGPAGLAAANDLALAGHGVTILEAADRAGGLLVWAIPEFRLPRDVVERDVEDVLALGVALETGRRLGADFTVEDLLAGGYDAVFLATGAGRGRPMRIEGEDARGVVDVIDLLGEYARGGRPAVGRRVLVVGGGDSAMDAARAALRLGAERVKVLYRRAAGEMPAAAHERARAVEEGVEIECQVMPARVLSEGGRVTGLECLRTEQGEPDEDGRRRPLPVEGSGFSEEADTIVTAIGQGPAEYPASLERTGDGFVEVDHLSGVTSDPRVFAGGDAVLGPATVVGAISTGRTAARAIDRMLRGEEPARSALFRGAGDASDASGLVPGDLESLPRLVAPVLEAAAARRTWDEVQTGASRGEALEEAGRCLGCGTCGRCEACITTFGCPAFYRDGEGSIRIDPHLCNGCGVCAIMCPNGAIVPAGGEP